MGEAKIRRIQRLNPKSDQGIDHFKIPYLTLAVVLVLAGLAGVMTRYPQVLVNVAGVDKARVASSPEVAAQVEAAERELGGSGRVLVRPSGTEPAVRVMIEAMDAGHAQRLADRLASAIREAS